MSRQRVITLIQYCMIVFLWAMPYILLWLTSMSFVTHLFTGFCFLFVTDSAYQAELGPRRSSVPAVVPSTVTDDTPDDVIMDVPSTPSRIAVSTSLYSGDTKRRSNAAAAGIMSVHRLRRWPNIKPALDERFVFSRLFQSPMSLSQYPLATCVSCETIRLPTDKRVHVNYVLH